MFVKARCAKTPPIKREELLYSNRSLVNIIVPLLLTQLLSILVSTVDTVMVSFAGACFRASGDTRTHFFVSLAVNMVNVCFNAFFIYKMGMGAAGDVRYPMVVSMATMWIFRVAGAYFCALESVSVLGLFTFPGLGLGIAGVWFAMTVDWLIRAVLFFIHFIKGKWALRKSVAVEGAAK